LGGALSISDKSIVALPKWTRNKDGALTLTIEVEVQVQQAVPVYYSTSSVCEVTLEHTYHRKTIDAIAKEYLDAMAQPYDPMAAYTVTQPWEEPPEQPHGRNKKKKPELIERKKLRGRLLWLLSQQLRSRQT
jgi:hypothetical protein